MKKTIGSIFLLFVLLTVLAMSGCAPAPTPEPTSTSTLTPTSTSTPTKTSTPTVTITSTPFGGGTGLIAYSRATDEGSVIDVIDSEGNVLFTLEDNDGSAFNPIWSSDGSKLFYLTLKRSSFVTTSFHTINSDGTNIVDLPSSGNIRSFSFSPDFRKVVYTKGGFNYLPSEIFIADFDGTNISNSVKIHDGSYPSFSPDGTKIVFMKGDTGNRRHQIFVINIDKSSLKALTPLPSPGFSGDQFPSWSPDGTKIVFSSSQDDRIGKIYIMNADGSDVVKLNDGGSYPYFRTDST
jgi:Tol biopolymer transport system component